MNLFSLGIIDISNSWKPKKMFLIGLKRIRRAKNLSVAATNFSLWLSLYPLPLPLTSSPSMSVFHPLLGGKFCCLPDLHFALMGCLAMTQKDQPASEFLVRPPEIFLRFAFDPTPMSSLLSGNDGFWGFVEKFHFVTLHQCHNFSS